MKDDGEEVKPREGGGHKQTRSHSHPCTRVHIAAHRTLEQSAMDKKIIPLSFLECSLLHPLTHSAPTHQPPPHPENTGSFLQTETVLSFITPVNLSSEHAVLGPSPGSRSSLGSSGPEYQVASKSNCCTVGQMCHLFVKTHQEVASV